ncbi:MAG TPA: PQQ-dependent sugar dehydrogenase [Acidimicrobiia bacterium]|jgi:glucose/arabinose dehydrogenase|nr:PQQ-dependent sugar dehydrogenase [Acidimicrobiia bacterium]
MRTRSLLLVVALVVVACGGAEDSTAQPATTAPASVPATPEGELSGLAVELLADGLSTPVAAVALPGDAHILIVEQTGKIRVFDGERVLDEPFLDVARFIEDEGLEQGLLSLAFHPEYETNGRAFVSFTNRDGDTRILEYRRDRHDPNRLDPSTGRRVLAIDQPHEYHNGGTVRFGPDGYLWIGIGDGGGIGDPFGNGQDANSLLGAVLRIDVDRTDGSGAYAIPGDNPFVGGGGAPEVWAYGLRNPWMFDFTDDAIVIAEVGQERWEEIIVVDLDAGGGNYGWPVVEGPDCYLEASCDPAPYEEATLLVEHLRTCALVGGPVYEGRAIPELRGHYFYGDFCVGWVRSAPLENGTLGRPTEWSRQFGELGRITALSEDGHGEPLMLTAEGQLYRVVPVRESE